MPVDVEISPIIGEIRWLRSGRNLWRQQWRPREDCWPPTQGTWHTLAGWRFATVREAQWALATMGYEGGEERYAASLREIGAR